jgi:ribose 5-phosphate isomerase
MIKGGGAQSADDKVIQHNGKGTVTIDGFSKHSNTTLLSHPLTFPSCHELWQALPRLR